MKRPFLTFLLLVVLPSAAAVVAAVASAERAWTDLRHTSHRRVAGMVLSALDQELALASARAVETAAPVSDADPSDPSVRRALAGDTLRGYRPGNGSLDVVVVLADESGTGVRTGSAPVAGDFVARVGRATGYATAVYLRGARWTGSEPPPGPERLSDDTLRALGAGPMRVDGGILWAGPDPPVSPPALSALAVPRNPAGRGVARPVILVMGLLLLFSALAGWIQLSRPPASELPPPSRASILLVALVPALTVLGLLSHLDRSFAEGGAAQAAADLTRGLAVASLRSVASSPRAVHDLTGFHATRVQRGQVVSSTFGVEGTAALATLPSPPPSFTSSGRVDTPEGPSAYVALRLREGGFVVATTPHPGSSLDRFRMAQRSLGGLLLVWLLAVGVMLLRDGPLRRPAREALNKYGQSFPSG